MDVIVGVKSRNGSMGNTGLVVARRTKPPYGIALLGGYVEVCFYKIVLYE